MTDSANPKRRNLWKILFGISLALNLLIVGALGGAFIRKGKGPTANHLASGFLYMRALDFKDKRALRKEILRNKDGRKLVKDRNQASFNSAVGILKSHPFDRAAFENLLDEQAKHAKHAKPVKTTACMKQQPNCRLLLLKPALTLWLWLLPGLPAIEGLQHQLLVRVTKLSLLHHYRQQRLI